MDFYLSKPGLICSAGSNSEELWNSVISGNQSGIKKINHSSGQDFFTAKIDDSKLNSSGGRFDMRIIRIENYAISQLDQEINLIKNKYSPDRIAVCTGSCDNGTEFSFWGHKEFLEKGNFPQNYNLEMQSADYVSTFIKEKYNLQGPAVTFSTACSSSAGAIVKTSELLQAGLADAVIAGGVDIVSDTVLLGFNSLEAVSSEITNPFSTNRHGITLGEAACFFIITKEPVFDSPKIKLLGFGESSDAYHMTSPDPSGDGAFRAMSQALSKAGLKPENIDYVNLHGTGTKFNDSMEAKATDKIFGEYKVPVSSTKSVTGHTLGAAGALELAICYETISHNLSKTEQNVIIPCQVWDKEKDSDLPELNFWGKDSVFSAKHTIKTCLSNSFAFGGANSCLIIGLED